MKKRNESDNQARVPSPDRLSMSRKGEGQESAKDFALHLAAMFRAELGEEDEQLDPVLNWELPVFEADYQEAAVDSGSDEDLYRAVADFLDDEVGEPAGDAQEDAFVIPSISARSDREAQRRAEREAKRQAEQEAQRRAEREAKRQTEQEAQRRAEREAKRQTEQEAQRRAEREAKRQAEQEAQRRTEREAKRQAEQEAQRRAEREAKRQAEQEAQRRTEREAKRQAEQEAQRRAEREAKRQAERPAPPQTETPAQERLVFFEPKQKKHSFFDSLTETMAAEEPASAPLPAEPPRRERRTDSTAAEQPSRRGQTTGASRREQTAGSTRRGQTRDNTRRPEKRPARRGEREDPTRRMATQARRDGRRDSPENAGFAEQLDAFRDPTMVSLRGFSTTPFEPPREDPSLEELFGPLGLKTAPPDPDDSPTRRGRTPRSAFDLPVDDPIRPLPSDEAAAADKATGNGQQATGEKGSGIEDQGSGIEDQGSGIEDQGSGIRDQGSGWMQDVGAVIGRPPEAEAIDETVGAVIGRPPEAKAFDEPAGAVIDRPPEAEAIDETVGAVIGRPPEAEAIDETVGAVIGRPPEAEAFDEPAGAVIGRPPEAEAFDEPVGAGAFDGPAPAADKDADLPETTEVSSEPADQAEISTEDAILDALRFLGDVPYPEEKAADDQSASVPASRPSAGAAPARRRREKKRSWFSNIFGGARTSGDKPTEQATGSGQQATGEKGSGIEDQGSGIEDQGSGIRDQGSGIRDQGSGIEDQGSGIRDQGSGWMQDVGAVIGRPPEAEAFDEPVGAVIGRPPEAEAFDEPAGAVIGRPPEAEAFNEPVGAVIGRPPEAEAFDEPAGAVIDRPPEAEAFDEPVGAVIDRPPEAEAFDEPVGAVIGRPPEAEAFDEPAEAGAFDGPIIAADNETDKPIEPAESVVPTASDEPALEEAASEADAPWSDDKLFAAVEALLDRPFFAGIDGLNDTTASGDVSAARDAAELEKAAQAKPGQSAAGVPSRREFDALTVPELFDYFGLPRTEERSETKDQGSETEDQRSETEDQGSETGEETAPAAPDGTSAGTSIACPPSPEPTEPQAEAVSEKAPEAEHAPELWDPLSLFSAPVDDGPPPLTPLSRDTTGTLPSLEELFGPAKEPAARAQRPAARPARRRQKRSWLQKLLGTAPARRERPRPQAADEATGDRQQPTVEKGSGIKDQGSGWMQGAEAVGDRPPEAEAFREDTAHTDGSLPSAPTQAEGSDIPAAADLSMVPDIPTAADIPAAPDIPAVPDLSKVPDIPAASDIPPASETIPGDVGSADDWDPLALFGGQAEDGELPTWAEYVRSRRAAAEAEAPTPGAEPEEESLGSLPEDVPEVPEETPAASVNRKADWPEIPELDRDPTLEELFGPGGTGEQDAETVPMDLSAAPEPAASGRNRRRSQTDALTLSDFLTAAVPMEEAAAAGKEPAGETLREAAREQTLTFGPAEPQTISTAPENPMGLILTWLDDKEEEPSGEETAGDWEQAREADSLAGAKPPKAAVSAAEYSTPPVSAASRRDSGADRADMDRSQEAEASGRTAGDSANGAQAEPDPFAGAHSVRPPEIRSPEKAPVPSADVRTSAGVAAAADKRSRRRERQDIEVLPPEEKTILHPEEAYRVYARPLDAIGSRLILTGLFTLLSLFFTLYLAQRWTFLPEIFSGGTTVYILLGLVALLVLVNRKLYFTEWRDENGLRPALLLGLATAFTALDCISAAKTLRPPFTVVVGGLLLVELWGRYDRGMALTTTVKVLRAEQLSAGVSEVQDITKGSRGLIRTKPDVERFMEKLETRDLTDRLLRIYTPVAAGIGLLLTLVISLWLKRDPFWTGALVFLGTVPVTGLLAFPRLFCLLARRLTEAQAALCGYHGAEVFGGEHSILIGDDDIFPAGSLTLNGFKVYNGNPDRMIAYAAAACRSSGSALDPIFEDLLVTHNGRHYTVDNFRFYDSGGIGASIQQDVVLLGSLDFMRRMGVHMDRGARVKQAVYMSLNGELAAVFAVRYNPPENLRRGLAAIAGNRHFKGILVTRTFLGTPGFLKAKFGIPTGAFAYPSTKERIRLSEAEMKRSGAQGAILAKDSFSGFAQAAAGGRLLRSATLGAAILTVLGGLTGLVLMGVLAALAALETATALNILLYVAAWLAPTLLLTAWARHF